MLEGEVRWFHRGVTEAICIAATNSVQSRDLDRCVLSAVSSSLVQSQDLVRPSLLCTAHPFALDWRRLTEACQQRVNTYGESTCNQFLQMSQLLSACAVGLLKSCWDHAQSVMFRWRQSRHVILSSFTLIMEVEEVCCSSGGKKSSLYFVSYLLMTVMLLNSIILGYFTMYMYIIILLGHSLRVTLIIVAITGIATVSIARRHCSLIM